MGRIYQIDVTRFLEDKASFWSLTISSPPCERSVLAEAKFLGFALPEKAQRVIRDGSRFVSLPKNETTVFHEIRGRARRTFLNYSIYFPFLPPSVIAVPKDRESEMLAEMNKIFVEFSKAKDALIEKLDKLREERRLEFLAAGEAIFAERAPTTTEGTPITKEDFLSRWASAFERAFPKRRDIETSYRFNLENVGAIKKTLSIATREEFLSDAETAAKLEVIKSSEELAKKEFYDFIAAAALNLRIGLLNALEPVVNGLAEGHSIGKREVEKIEKHLEQIKSFDIFGDAKLEEMIVAVRKATATLKEGIDGIEKARAEMKLSETLEDVKEGLKKLEFDPTSFRRLELDGDEEYATVFADKEVMAEIREAMTARLTDAIAELALKGGTDEEKRDREQRLRTAVGLKKLADEGADEATLSTAARFINLELDD